MEPPVLILTGPTAVGKTALSIDLAERAGAEIISADSRQIYRELSVGTAKPDARALARVRHHFVDERSLPEPFSAGAFAVEAAQRLAEIRARGRRPLVVGGSTLYLRALTHGLADIPTVPAGIRRAVEQELAELGGPALYEQLRAADPAAAATMDPTKTQRLVRALEVLRHTGRTISSFHAAQQPPAARFRTVVLTRARDPLYARIDARVDRMLAEGLLDEVRGLLAAGYSPELNPLRTIGYQEPIAFLREEVGYDEMVRRIKTNTRRYAKRQLTWFRRDPQAEWIDLDGEADPARRLQAYL